VRRVICAALVAAGLAAFGAPPATAAVVPWQKGANLTAWWHDAYAQPQSDDSLRALAATGTKSVSIVTTWYMDTPQSSGVHALADKTPADDSLLHAMKTAQGLGMDVVLKPHVDVVDGTFRGDIAPADRGAWWASYRAMIDHYAQLASGGGARMLIVGTELTSMSGDDAQWRQTIADARARFAGALTFAANWTDGAQRVSFWDALDYIGVDAYMPLADGPSPSVDALTNAWRERGYADKLTDLHNRFGKPLLFTELGYQSRIDTAMRPWGGASGDVDQGAQAAAYEAAFRAFWDVPWFAGIYWWDWSATSGADPGGYGLAGNAAQHVIEDWYARPRTEPATTTTTTTTTPATTTTPGTVRGTTRRAGKALVSIAGVRGRVVKGSVRRGGTACRTRVTLKLSGHVKRPRSVRTSAAGAFRFALHGLPKGRYRVQAQVKGGTCGAARSHTRAFRVR
jgi:hypothetical protein